MIVQYQVLKIVPKILLLSNKKSVLYRLSPQLDVFVVLCVFYEISFHTLCIVNSMQGFYTLVTHKY